MSIDDLNSWAKFAASAATIIASGVAVFGINSWRREHIGKRKAELAENTLVDFYQAQDAISHMRNVASAAHERKRPEGQGRETPQEKEARDSAYVFFFRLSQYSELFSRIWAARYRFRAIFGQASTQPFKDLEQIVRDIRLSARKLSRIWVQQGQPMTDDVFRRHLEEMKINEAIFWEGEDPDPIRERLTKVITTIEGICQPAIIQRSYVAGAVDILERANKAIEKTRIEPNDG